MSEDLIVESPNELTRVPLDRDLLAEEILDDAVAQFRGEWSPDEPQGWETFTVMLRGEEGSDYAYATWEDLARIVAAHGLTPSPD